MGLFMFITNHSAKDDTDRRITTGQAVALACGYSSVCIVYRAVISHEHLPTHPTCNWIIDGFTFTEEYGEIGS